MARPTPQKADGDPYSSHTSSSVFSPYRSLTQAQARYPGSSEPFPTEGGATEEQEDSEHQVNARMFASAREVHPCKKPDVRKKELVPMANLRAPEMEESMAKSPEEEWIPTFLASGTSAPMKI